MRNNTGVNIYISFTKRRNGVVSGNNRKKGGPVSVRGRVR